MQSIVHVLVDEHGTPRTIHKNVKVKMIGERHVEAGATAAEIAEHYGITLADVHAALAYYFDNQAAFEQQAQKNQALLHERGQSGKALIEKWRQQGE